MQMRENMAHILKFVNVIIIFLLIFVVVIDGIVVTGKFNFQIYFKNLFLILYTLQCFISFYIHFFYLTSQKLLNASLIKNVVNKCLIASVLKWQGVYQGHVNVGKCKNKVQK